MPSEDSPSPINTKWSEKPRLGTLVLTKLKANRVTKKILKSLDFFLHLILKTISPVLLRLPWVGSYRFLFIPVQHIGHLATDLDCYAKELYLGKRRSYRGVVLTPPSRQCNPHLIEYLKREATFITDPFLCAMLKPFARMKPLQFNTYRYSQITDDTSDAPRINKEWGSRIPLWRLTDDDESLGLETLAKLGVNHDEWFVCVVCREYGYQEWDIHNYRDSNISNYQMAMDALVNRGAWVIRVGDPSMRPIQEKHGIIDYCHSPFRSPQMDIFLAAKCKFSLGSTGISWVSSIFGVPVASANMAPMGALPYLRPGDIAIPKLYWSKPENRYLGFHEILNSPMANFRETKLFQDAGIELVENTPEDIRDLALEMLDNLDGKFVSSEDDEYLGNKFKLLFKRGHYAFGSGATVANSFLRRYEKLLQRDPIDSMD